MVSAATAAGVALIVVVHAAIAAFAARFFRITLNTRLGAVIYTLVLVPVVYVVTTILFGVLGVGAGTFADPGSLIVTTWAFPFFLGWSVHLFWLPPVEEFSDRPENTRQ
ncbi:MULTISPECIES: hypothetical protein [Halobacterium]|uniref:hypothetical protein n=1 Tax=Halobacterium TaxID=2239 RepID=UPI001963C23D|nr:MULTISPECIES: hypothetical protein [Halobacterium]MCF2166184.1 hypothetical protein [Halobacterium salinarum]MCF2167667.1 hypothetical protein [Halobacterium salinarum]MDL0121887.1 hypothetical protein [Halobacterium salinarum]MDL0127709.1 hypothetical protein [Halobacterium salinarum]MDL0132677.1 hypothetical protein [Halobacterium salinarum]